MEPSSPEGPPSRLDGLALASVALAGLSALVGWRLALRGFCPGPLGGLLYLAWLAAAYATWRAFIGIRRRAQRTKPASALRHLSRGLALLAVLLGWGLAEGTLFLTGTLMPQRLRQLGFLLPGDGVARLGEAHFNEFFARHFDSQLGWDLPETVPFGRARRAPVVYERTLAGTFGDSFTACFGPDEETWQAHLSARLRANVVNFGVRGHGPDQTLLKLEREYPLHPTPVVLFGYFSESIVRLLNVYRTALDVCYAGACALPDGSPMFEPTKPRLRLSGGRLELIPNPVQSREDLRRLVHDPGFLAGLRPGDYFADGYDLERTCVPWRFPRTLSLLKRVGRGAARQRPRDFAAEVLQDRDAFDLLLAIFGRFQALSRELGFKPLILLFGQPRDLRDLVAQGRHGRLQKVIEALDERGYAYVDTLRILARHHANTHPATALTAYFDDTSHLSMLSHRILADALAEHPLFLPAVP